jgi:hypothetical protein
LSGQKRRPSFKTQRGCAIRAVQVQKTLPVAPCDHEEDDDEKDRLSVIDEAPEYLLTDRSGRLTGRSGQATPKPTPRAPAPDVVCKT